MQLKQRLSHINPIVPIIILSFVLLLLISVSVTPITPQTPGWDCECSHIIYEALDKAKIMAAPFSWRLLKPMIVHVLPLDYSVSNWILSFLTLWGTSILTYVILRRYHNQLVSLIGLIIFFSTYWLVAFNMTEIYFVDTVLIFFMTLAIYAAYTRRPSLFLIAVLFGLLTKEQAILVLPLWITLYPGRITKQLLIQTIVLVLPGLLLLIALRIVLPPAGYDYIALVRTIIPLRVAQPVSFLEYLPLGIFTPLVLFSGKKGANVLLRYSPLIVGTYVQLLIASDTGRIMVYDYLPFLIAALYPIAVIARAIYAERGV